MKITDFNMLREALKENEKVKVVIAGAKEEEILLAWQARDLADFILLGDQEEMVSYMKQHGVVESAFELIHMDDYHAAGKKAIQLIHEGKADLPMKGNIHTSAFMGAVLNKESGLKRERRLSQITLFSDTKTDKQGIKFLTDCAINIDLTLKVKQELIENAVLVAKLFGIDTPKVALLSAVETVKESMPDTIDSSVLTQMNRRGQIKGCLIDGPLSLDNAISKEAAIQKGIDSEVAGVADILVGSSLQESNSLSKSLNFYGNLATASVIVGTKQPIIMTSRTDAMENKINSIAATCYYQSQIKVREASA